MKIIIYNKIIKILIIYNINYIYKINIFKIKKKIISNKNNNKINNYNSKMKWVIYNYIKMINSKIRLFIKTKKKINNKIIAIKIIVYR